MKTPSTRVWVVGGPKKTVLKDKVGVVEHTVPQDGKVAVTFKHNVKGEEVSDHYLFEERFLLEVPGQNIHA